MQVIDRRTNLGPAEFVESYLIPRRPVVVADAAANWKLWKSVAEMEAELGERIVQVYDDLFDLKGVVPLRAYLKDNFGRDRELDPDRPLPYVRWYTKFKDIDFVWADEAFAGFADRWDTPYFLPQSDYLLPSADSERTVSPARDPFPAKGLFISCRGAATRAHHDPWASDAVLCQLLGTKQLNLQVSQASGPEAAAKPADSGDPAAQAILSPGDVLYIPRGILHSAISLTDSVSLTWNFVHRSTWPKFFQHLTSPAASAEAPVLRYFAKLAGAKIANK